MNSEFELKTCKLVVRERNDAFEVLVEAGHSEGPIWLAIGQSQITTLKQIFASIKVSPRIESKLAQILRFIKVPATNKQIRDRFGDCHSALNKLIADGAARKYDDENPIQGRGSSLLCTWFVSTGKEYTKHRESKTYKPRSSKRHNVIVSGLPLTKG